MTIQILGGGCPNCKQLEKNARRAIERLNIDATIEKITDSEAIMEMGVMMTPALAIDGEVKSTGRILSPDEVIELL